jgi:hypothetical protein
MKKKYLITIMLVMCFIACTKSSVPPVPPSNDDPDYDAHNRVLRVDVSSTSAFVVVISEIDTTSNAVYNMEQASQATPFDYGFTPVIGHKVTVSIKSDKGLISSTVSYKGNSLGPVNVQSGTDGSSTAAFSYTVKD